MKDYFSKYKTSSLILAVSVLGVSIGLFAGYLIFQDRGGSGHGKEDKVGTETQTMGEHIHHEGDTHRQQGPIPEGMWTCSMHPQIRQESAGDCPICGMELVPASVSTPSSPKDPTVLEMTAEAVKLAQIETTIIGAIEQEAKTLTLSGKIQMDERLSASQVTHVPGRIESLYVSFEGEQVYHGQKVASLYSPELITAQRELLEALRLQATNPGLLEAARKKLAYWKVPQSMIERVEQTGEIQQNFDLLADVTGVVTKRMVAVGDHLNQGEVLFEVVDLNHVWVLFDAYEEDLKYVKVGDTVQFTTPALPQVFRTTISFIDPVLNPETRVASLRGEVVNIGKKLKPEMFVKGVLHTHLPANQGQPLSVPASAVLWTGERSVVYVKVPYAIIPSFQYREISLGERIGDNYIVKAGLSAGDEVVSQGSFTIDAAAQLNNQQSMMNSYVKIDLSGISDGLEQLSDNHVQQILEAYLAIKDALVITQVDSVHPAAQQLVATIEDIPLSHDVLNKISAQGLQIASSTSIEVQREYFYPLSDLMYKFVQETDVSSQPIFVQYCPMAFDNTGAYWLSTEEEILNPYFGNKMLRCGTVRERLFEE